MKIEPIEFEVNGLTLRGNFYKADKPEKITLLFLHGWTGRANEDTAKHMAENGFTSLTFSLSGHNNSDGEMKDQTRQKSLQEALAAYDFLKSKLPNDAKIGVVGNSYGGYLASVLSADRDVALLSLRVPANYLDETFTKTQMGQGHEDPVVLQWRQQKLDFNATRSLKAIHEFSGPIQIIEAELDDVVHHQCVQNYAEAVKDKSKLDYHFMKGWPHSMGDDPNRKRIVLELLLNWVKQQV